ncbi:hypothetical protein [Marinigracilibium pacificum]|nr:hypothetical protein [Marinigracilibium pacificum]
MIRLLDCKSQRAKAPHRNHHLELASERSVTFLGDVIVITNTEDY